MTWPDHNTGSYMYIPYSLREVHAADWAYDVSSLSKNTRISLL